MSHKLVLICVSLTFFPHVKELSKSICVNASGSILLFGAFMLQKAVREKAFCVNGQLFMEQPILFSFHSSDTIDYIAASVKAAATYRFIRFAGASFLCHYWTLAIVPPLSRIRTLAARVIFLPAENNSDRSFGDGSERIQSGNLSHLQLPWEIKQRRVVLEVSVHSRSHQHQPQKQLKRIIPFASLAFIGRI